MCGIAGILGAPLRGAELTNAVSKMTERIRHRGPDAGGTWQDDSAGLALGHRRLSIIDLSPTGEQPMKSATGRYVTVFNGEIYNFKDLKARLVQEGRTFRGTSDTEVMLHAIESWGIAAFLESAIGMFAVAVWDVHEKQLTLARDRFGEKPLYFGRANGHWAFASELKAIRSLNPSGFRVNLAALDRYLALGYVPEPLSIFEGIGKLPKASFVTLKSDVAEASPKPYWSATAVVREGFSKPFGGTPEDAVQEIEGLLKAGISRQMIADVPLGAFLSGGIDSSTIVSLMQEISSRPVKTFTIGFEDPAFDESAHARSVASHLKTDHHELRLSSEDVRAVIPLLPEIYDEPFADESQIPTYLVAKMARGFVTVSLSGDGGDELFGGYRRYFAAQSAWSKVAKVPYVVRRAAGLAIAAPGPMAWQVLTSPIGGTLRRRFRLRTIGDKFTRFGDLAGARDFAEFYQGFMTHWGRPAAIMKAAPADAGVKPVQFEHADPLRQMMTSDTEGYLTDDVMVKVDRAAMAVSLETRAPFLDHTVAGFAMKLPTRHHVVDGEGKWILRQILYKRAPKALFDRPKMGFGVPMGDWLKGPLKGWVGDLISPDLLKRQGFFHPEPIHQKWREHQAGAADWHYLLWNLLMFQAWLQSEP